MLQIAKSSAGSQWRAGSAGSLDSLAEILGPLPPSADNGTNEGKARPKADEGSRCEVAAGPVAAGGSPVAVGAAEQSGRAKRTAASR